MRRARRKRKVLHQSASGAVHEICKGNSNKIIRMKKTLYVDLDGVTADFMGRIRSIHPQIDQYDQQKRDNIIDILLETNPRIFKTLNTVQDSVKSIKSLSKLYEIYFLSTPVYSQPYSYMDKRLWLEIMFGEMAKKKLILTHNKGLNLGDYLIDDRTANGAGEFKGKLILFGSEEFPNWEVITQYLLKEEQYA